LDTNIIIALLEGADTVLSNLDQAAEVFIPAIALGELFFGAANPAVLPRTPSVSSDSRPAGLSFRAILRLLANMGV
jgi:predicted nucleic acid-binding protein